MTEEKIALFENYDYCSAFVGLTTNNIAIYDYELMVEYLVVQGMDFDEAVKWLDYNTINTYLGEKTPIIYYPAYYMN